VPAFAGQLQAKGAAKAAGGAGDERVSGHEWAEGAKVRENSSARSARILPH
jgi:hypothetical protein